MPNSNYDYMYDILIIDSGISVTSAADKTEFLDAYYFSESGLLCKSENVTDEIGHGTAVYSIIAHETHDAKICCIKIFDEDFCVNEKRLISALTYICEHISCRIINMSLGICNGEYIPQLEEVCKKITNKGTIIVSAFDNNGSYSFPAAFDTVIGVDNWYQCKSVEKFEYVCNSKINIRAKGGMQRVTWKNGNSVVIGGSSFACAHISAYIFNLIYTEKQQFSLAEILAILEEHAENVYTSNDEPKNDSVQRIPFSIQKAVLFPFNKEMHQLVRYAKSLPFQITSIYDIAQSGRVGVHSDKIVVKSQFDCSNQYTIKDINKIEYGEFDTLILGHMDEINRICGYDLRFKILSEMLQYGKNVYAFDAVENEIYDSHTAQVFFPSVTHGDVENNFGKLYHIHKPVVGVCGTSSAQGKFTLQLILRRLFIQSGYSVGEIGTEPHSLLFGMDYVYPIGYASHVMLDDFQAISVLNHMEYMLCQKDVIIVGTQANTIPLSHNNISAVHIRNSSFLLGTNPDIMIVCVNPDDDMDYILNTIKYVEGFLNCVVLAVVLYPMKVQQDWRAVFGIKVPISNSEFEEISQSIYATIHRPVFRLGDLNHMNQLFNLIIDYLSE